MEVPKSVRLRGRRRSGKMESAPLQIVSVAQCDHTTVGGRQTPLMARITWKASLELVSKSFEMQGKESRAKMEFAPLKKVRIAKYPNGLGPPLARLSHLPKAARSRMASFPSSCHMAALNDSDLLECRGSIFHRAPARPLPTYVCLHGTQKPPVLEWRRCPPAIIWKHWATLTLWSGTDSIPTPSTAVTSSTNSCS